MNTTIDGSKATATASPAAGAPTALRPASVADVEYAAGHKNMRQLIELRWIAVVGQLSTIAAASLVFDVHLPLVQMLEVLACLIAFNIASHLRWHEHRPVPNSELFLALL